MVVLKEGSRPPWVGLGAAVWMQIASGNAFTFPLYSPSLKSVLGFNQQQLTILGVANDIGENVGILPGIACNKFPPWAVLLVGAFASFLGYGVLWLAVSKTVQSMPYWVLWFALCIATNSSAWIGTAILVTNMRNFPLSRGTVSGILKGYAGLSAAVFTEVYSMVLNGSASSLLLLLALGIPSICLVMMYFIRRCTPASGEDSAEHCHFLFTQGASLCLAVFLLTTTILKDLLPLSKTVSYIFIAIMVILLMAPLAIPLKMTLFPKKPGQPTDPISGDGDSNQTDPLLTPSSSATFLGSFYEPDDISEVDLLLAVGEGAVKKRKPRRGEDFKFREAIVKADFWLLWFVYFLGVGSGVTVLNNLAQIGVSLGVDNATTLLTLSGTLYAATALLGICYGVQFGIMIPTASELFGLKHFGIIFNFMALGNPARWLCRSNI
ncbi:UNVERIFIED_CONTAM: hypothetical protein Sradi_1047700 [Sesamum radiatum]|uniref:Nodulin-like domain-containing protein n=1 Tax=Sesamum radiatum TaxID=300843 RepID=A0AAW2V7Z5_SESRA